uniref:Uncharacterized protein n=1 Tax=Glossina brevipalpis TaxID=37001 RepID=A0A1A9WLZ8_9MUSC
MERFETEIDRENDSIGFMTTISKHINYTLHAYAVTCTIVFAFLIDLNKKERKQISTEKICRWEMKLVFLADIITNPGIDICLKCYSLGNRIQVRTDNGFDLPFMLE